jgi:phosphoribosyl-ATP pyrophosphohydrolase/phosphoribosyl-AMP cyclohydrolase
MSCFGDESLSADVFSRLDAAIASRAADLQIAPSSSPSYTQRLLHDRNLRLKKIGEEAAEFVIACTDDDPAGAVEEAADLTYHVMVALHGVGRNIGDVRAALGKRAK